MLDVMDVRVRSVVCVCDGVGEIEPLQRGESAHMAAFAAFAAYWSP
jgi:hypothetical protein